MIYFLWLSTCLWQILVWSYWIQVKEYQFDRFWSFIKTSDGRGKVYLSLVIVKLFLLMTPLFSHIFYLLLTFGLIVEDVVFIVNSQASGFRKPVFTKRILTMLGISSISFLLPLFVPIYTGILLGELSLVLLVIIGILYTQLLVNRTREKEKAAAIEKLQKIKPFVIAITGSYGKTTTKDFISHLLSQKYKTQKTQNNENTYFGVVRTINNKLENDTKYFVTEIGAYRKGEVKELSDVVKPKIAVITGIEPQHVDLFGSMENLKSAKFEIVGGLNNSGVAIFNLGDKECEELYEKSLLKYPNVKSFGYKVFNKRDKSFSNFRLYSVVEQMDIDKVIFTTVEKDSDTKKTFKFNTTGAHFVENVTCAILVSRILGLTWDEIEKGVKSLILPKGTMSVKTTRSGAVIIDDSYNSSPKSFNAAIDYLSLFKNRRKIIFSGGIIELGSMSKNIHRDLGIKMNDIADKIIFTNKDSAKDVSLGMGNRNKLSYVANINILKQLLQKHVEDGYVILLEGRQPGNIMEVVKNL